MNIQTRSNGITRWLALCGVLGPVVYLVTFTVAGFLRPEALRRAARRCSVVQGGRTTHPISP